MKAITFDQLKSKLLETSQSLDFVISAALDDSDYSHAPWLHKPTLARWFYQSAQEFVMQYNTACNEYLRNHRADTDFVASTTSSLARLMRGFRFSLREKFYEDRLLMEATK